MTLPTFDKLSSPRPTILTRFPRYQRPRSPSPTILALSLQMQAGKAPPLFHHPTIGTTSKGVMKRHCARRTRMNARCSRRPTISQEFVAHIATSLSLLCINAMTSTSELGRRLLRLTMTSELRSDCRPGSALSTWPRKEWSRNSSTVSFYRPFPPFSIQGLICILRRPRGCESLRERLGPSAVHLSFTTRGRQLGTTLYLTAPNSRRPFFPPFFFFLVFGEGSLLDSALGVSKQNNGLRPPTVQGGT